MILFEQLKTGDPIKDAIITTIILTCMSYIIQNFYNIIKDKISTNTLYKTSPLDFIYKRYAIEFEGKISSSTNYFDNSLYQTSAFSARFKALWKHIIDNIKQNSSINRIKEYHITGTRYNNQSEENRDVGVYMVNQRDRFLISEKYQIYAITEVSSEQEENEDKDSNKKTKYSNQIDKIKIEVFSYKSDIEQIKNYIDIITNQYLDYIENIRQNKRFIYSLTNNTYQETKFEMWAETLFTTTSSFKNLFFEDKNYFLNTLQFFLNNKEWYVKKGIPYTLGIGLHGPPGTGKTTLIKALAAETERDIIIISLKLIKTKKQLDSIYFEERYNADNKKNSITFDKKIIVFEDIDCIGDIVKCREKKKKDELSDNMDNQTNINTLIENLANNFYQNDKQSEKVVNMGKFPSNEEPITLDDILNLWDGIRETPGRILIISSNYYNELDKALTRPGRIDISLKLSFASYSIIKQIYEHLFEEIITIDELTGIQEFFYTPAELVKIYMTTNKNANTFLNRLRENSHLHTSEE
jgi:hypothetical protein